MYRWEQLKLVPFIVMIGFCSYQVPTRTASIRVAVKMLCLKWPLLHDSAGSSPPNDEIDCIILDCTYSKHEVDVVGA